MRGWAARVDSVGTRSGNPDDGTVQRSHQFAVQGKDGTVYSSFELKTISTKPAQMPKAMILKNDRNSNNAASKSLQEIVKKLSQINAIVGMKLNIKNI